MLADNERREENFPGRKRFSVENKGKRTNFLEQEGHFAGKRREDEFGPEKKGHFGEKDDIKHWPPSLEVRHQEGG